MWSQVIGGLTDAGVHGIEQYRDRRQRHQNENNPEEQSVDDLRDVFPASAVVDVGRRRGGRTPLCR